MRCFDFAVLAAALVFCLTPNKGQAQIRPPPLQEGVWYFCPASSFYYPWVQACAQNWQAQRSPEGSDLPPAPPRPTGVNAHGEQQWQIDIDDRLRKYRSEQQQARLINQAATEGAARDAQTARLRAEEERRGVHYISLSDLQLDKKTISSATTLVVQGIYQPVDDAEWLVMVPNNPNFPKVGLITDSTPREVRAVLQRCRLSLFCSITLVGHLGPCQHTFVGRVYKQDRCLYVTGKK